VSVLKLSERALARRTSFSKPWIKFSEALDVELRQAWDEGRALPTDIQARIDALLAIEDEDWREYEARLFYRFISQLPYRDDYPYVEPNGYEDILKQRSGEPPRLPKFDPDSWYDRVYGAFLARCAGCMLGQPVEGWKSPKIIGYMKDTGNYPLNNYFRSDVSDALRAKYQITEDGYLHQRPRINWGNNTDCAPEDDDTDWSILALKLLEEIGTSFTPEDAGINWLNHFPMFHTAVSERIGYRNLANGIDAELCGSYCNPHRETLGAQIRADAYGYAAPGDPERAASMAWRDATLTNAKNGLYGAMLVAAMLAAAAATNDPALIVQAGLAQIPTRSRLHEAISQVMNWYEVGRPVEEVCADIHERYSEMDSYTWVHVVGNAMIVVMALMYGALDLTKSLGLCVTMGHDTDCNCATVGSVIGIALGAGRLPPKWLVGVNNQVYTCVATFDDKLAIDKFARRLLAAAGQ